MMMVLIKGLSRYFLLMLCLSNHVVSEHMELDKFVFGERSCELHNISSKSELTSILTSLIADHNGFKYAYYKGYRFLTDFTELSCINTQFDKIPSKLFEEFSELKTLHASNVELQEIIRDDFKFAEHLTDMDLSGNNLTHLENKIFIHLQQLENLDLSRNHISSIHEDAFEGMSINITSVNLSFNKFEDFSEHHLITLGKDHPRLLIINLEGNNIKKIAQSNSLISGKVKIKFLNLQNNQIKHFESSLLEIAELNLNNNQLENLKLLSTIEVLEMNNNKIQEFVINKSMRNVSAVNNQIRALKCHKNLSIESLYLSGNEITNEVFVELKYADKMKVLDLSNTPMGTLSVDSFAEMKFLERLNLGNTRIVKISFGLFSHQQNLQVLNISHNNLGSFDYHMFTTLRNLRSLDISGNNLTELKNHENFHDIFPRLFLITLDENSWECEYLSKLILSLIKQRTKVDKPLRPVKNDSSLYGIGCSIVEPTTVQESSESADVDKNLSTDLFMFDYPSFDMLKHKSEQMRFTTLETVLIVVVSMMFILLVFLGFPYIKNFVKPNLIRMRQSTENSRHSSVNTIATFVNSNV